MKYQIQIIQLPEEKPQRDEFGMINRGILDGGADVIFQAYMKSEHAIEILRRLYDLKERERFENTPKKSIN